jgi:hypothetical protein
MKDRASSRVSRAAANTKDLVHISILMSWNFVYVWVYSRESIGSENVISMANLARAHLGMIPFIRICLMIFPPSISIPLFMCA